MKIKRKFFIEQERTTTIRFGSGSPFEQFCPLCSARSRFVTVDEAAIFCGTNSRMIFRLVENDRLHSQETPLGLLLVCFQSLSAFKNQENQK
ncbi:MAG: hypothetical protein M3209_15405 [Acidobacteriota bacterium]|nr:hypothetical protein [Acidobacteriota bacterium]